MTFVGIAADLRVVRPSRLLWEVDMIIRGLAKTNFLSETWGDGVFLKFIITTTSNPYQPTQKREFSQVTRMTSGPSKKFSVASHDMNLFLQASLRSYLSPRANGVVVRHVDKILWSETQASGDFWNFMLTEPSSTNYLKSRKSWKTGIFFFFYRSRERKKCRNILYQILKVVN